MKRRWCQICRDEFDRSDELIECCMCPRRFHKECVLSDLQAQESIDPSDFKCNTCLAEEEQETHENDERCKICRETEKEEKDLLLLCDGCPNSYHMSCLNLLVEPDGEKWYCPECRPQDHNIQDIRRLGRRPTTDQKEHINANYCYVCQRPGRLLGCDLCPNSFHPNCLPDLDFDSFGDKGEWECPCCRGQDPLLNQAHKRWTKVEMDVQAKDCDRSLRYWRSKIITSRNRFLVLHSEVLEPFITTKQLMKLQRPFLEERSKLRPVGKGRLRRASQSDFLQEYLEDVSEEMEEEAIKFVKRAYKAARHKGGRKIEGRPLREGVSLQTHQEAGVEWLLRAFLSGGGILADEMGLGKTIQTLCFLAYLQLMNIVGPHLIVVPLSTVGCWLREIHRFTPQLTVIKVCGSKHERMHSMQDRLAMKGLYNIYITTYETVKNEEAFFVEVIPQWQCIVLDEAHRIKTQSGAIRHSMDRVSGNMRLLLTGTPLQNSAAELFTLINFLFPDVFKDSLKIEEYFLSGGASSISKPSGKKPVKVDFVDMHANIKKENFESVRLLLSKIMLRRMKEQAIQLPMKKFREIWLALSPTSAEWYKKLLDIRSLQDEGVSFKKLLGLVIKLRIICGHPKGMVSRDTQIEKLKAFFLDESDEIKKETLTEAIHLRKIEGKEHILASAKLTFLDKLLCQLHLENIKYVTGYEEKYLEYRREQTAYKFHRMQEQEEKAEAASGGKKKDKRKRVMPSDFENTVEFKRLFEYGAYWNDFPSAMPSTVQEMFFASMQNSSIYEEAKRQTVASTHTASSPPLSSVAMKSKRRMRLLRLEEEEEEDTDTKRLDAEDTSGFSPVISLKEEASLNSEDSFKHLSPFLNGDYENKAKKENVSEEGVNAGNSLKEVEAPLRASEDALSEENNIQMHKLLIFTQFQLILDELEAYCNYRGWKYARLDGSTNKFIRELDIREFNLKDSTCFVYLISTRAGGLGINLTAANHVILFDEDWNPFVDMQAIDRAHRIGQQRDVNVWKLITEWTVEERMAFRREQKLKLEGILMQSTDDFMDFDQEDAEAPEEKLSAEEIRKLMLHGKTAIQKVAAARPISLAPLSLQECIERTRQILPILEGMDTIELDNRLSVEADDEALLVDVGEVMHDEAEEPEHVHYPPASPEGPSLPSLPSPPTRSETGDTDVETLDSASFLSRPDAVAINKKAIEEEFIAAGALTRPRERKKPKEVYTPSDWGHGRETRIIKHEAKCFICGFGKNVTSTLTDTNGTVIEHTYGELVGCFRCPRAYHHQCAILKEDIKKTWTCRWHECYVCFRKASQCGGHLIHCATCPTSFCFDCFPPDYVRYHAGEDYYYNLCQRGFAVSPKNWILYMCSKCKAVATQSKQREISKTESDAALQRQREIREEAKRRFKADHEFDNGEKKRFLHDKRAKKMEQLERERQFIERRQKIDAEEEAVEMELRNAYTALFPLSLVEEVQKRAEEAKQLKLLSSACGVLSEGTGISPPLLDVSPPIEVLEGETQSPPVVVASSSTTFFPSPSPLPSPSPQTASTSQSKATAALKNKMFHGPPPKPIGKFLALCDNCKFPCHNTTRFPSSCCFPAELVRITAASPSSTLGSNGFSQGESMRTLTPGMPLTHPPLSVSGSRDFSSVVLLASPSETSDSSQIKLTTQSISESPDSAGVSAKSISRGKCCSLCGMGQKIKLAHSRKHCLELSELAIQEYQDRHQCRLRLINALRQQHPLIQTQDNFSSYSYQKLKSFVNKLTDQADEVVEHCMYAVGLDFAIAKPRQSFKKQSTVMDKNSHALTTAVRLPSTKPAEKRESLLIDLCSPSSSPQVQSNNSKPDKSKNASSGTQQKISSMLLTAAKKKNSVVKNQVLASSKSKKEVAVKLPIEKEKKVLKTGRGTTAVPRGDKVMPVTGNRNEGRQMLLKESTGRPVLVVNPLSPKKNLMYSNNSISAATVNEVDALCASYYASLASTEKHEQAPPADINKLSHYSLPKRKEGFSNLELVDHGMPSKRPKTMQTVAASKEISNNVSAEFPEGVRRSSGMNLLDWYSRKTVPSKNYPYTNQEMHDNDDGHQGEPAINLASLELHGALETGENLLSLSDSSSSSLND